MGTCSMCIDIFNLGWLYTRFFHGKFHCSGRSCPILCRGCDMKCICCCTITNQFCINSGTSCFCMFQFFKNNDSGTFPKYKATSVFIKRNGRSCGIFCFSKCGKCGKPGYTGWADTAFGSSRQHNLCIPVLNRTERIADTVCSRSAGCYNVSTFAAKPKLNGDISCCHIGDHHRHHQRINFSRSLRDDFFIVIFNLRKASDS